MADDERMVPVRHVTDSHDDNAPTARFRPSPSVFAFTAVNGAAQKDVGFPEDRAQSLT